MLVKTYLFVLPMNNLFEQERIARIDGDIKKLEEIQHNIIMSCTSDDEVIQTLRTLINKRKQEPDCMKKLIKTVFSMNKNVEFLKNLLNRVIEGRIFLEDERIDIAEYIKNTLGNNISESYGLIKDIPVETFTTISERMRNNFLFEQFRLSLLLKKFEDSELITRRIRKGYLSNDERKIFLNYCILLRIAQSRFIEASTLFLELNEIDESRKYIVLGSLYCIISSCLIEERNIVEEKTELLKKFRDLKDNDETMRTFLKKFTSDLVIDFNIIDHINEVVSKYEESIDRSILIKSITEHNFFVISKFFSKIEISQMSELMNIDENELVLFISEMVNSKFISTKINQVQGLVNFENKKWNDSIDNVLDKIVLASYLIHKESISKQ